ncbi:breast cancer anti-estrogen resistance protein 1 isoform X3 [Dermacentor andersoni]|uniref:breast cancer anti-estrogen resistance protein 1 isoform X3 n=1 Tax=Dermacentor andersoni TaxID=34620 RepID=UPI002155E04E|nr:breast cancer anti-estrogen resistance protein 1-like isoform X3 [Dermacentor andersoni]
MASPDVLLQSALLAHRLKCRAAATRSLNCLARALYDNIAESPEELAFRKNDVLTVLEQNPGDLEGWWLCALRGRQGLAPGNRLRLMPGMYDPTGLGYAAGPPDLAAAVPPAPPAGTYPGPGQRHARRRSWRVDPNKVVTPSKVGDVYLYDVPVGAKVTEEYDTPAHSTLPRPSGHVHIDTIVPAAQEGRKSVRMLPNMAYDEPRPSSLSYDLPRPSVNARLEFPSSTTAGTESYDVPRPKTDYDVPNSELVGTYDTPPPARGVTKGAPCSVYDVPLDSGTPRCVLAANYDVPTSGRSSGVSLLSTSSSSAGVSPASRSNRSSLEQGHEMYDIPTSSSRRVIDAPPSRTQSPRGNLSAVPPPPGHGMTLLQFYDVPTNNAPAPFYDTPPKRAPTTQTVCMEGVYDVPPQVTRDAPLPPPMMDETDASRRHSSSSSDSHGSRDYETVGDLKELHLERDAALEVLVKVQQELTSAIGKLFSLTHSTLKRQESVTAESRLYDIKTSCHKLRTSLKEFLNFAQGALANASHVEDRKLYQKLGRLTKPLLDSYQVVVATTQALDDKGWQLCMSREAGPDELDQLIACARGLTEDIQQVASTIQGNSTLIFKKSPLISESGRTSQERPLPVPPRKEDDQWASDYDYVNLESKASVERENEEIKAALPAELSQSFDKLLQQSQLIVEGIVQEPQSLSGMPGLDQNDLQILNFYGAQIDTHILFLTNAIDAFLATIENNQPPKVFIGHSKFVVISAHKLVYMGDTVYRNIVNVDIKNKVLQCSSNLCEALKVLINSTKKAALQFPSVAAVQEMVDSIVDVSHLANDLKVVVMQAKR